MSVISSTLFGGDKKDVFFNLLLNSMDTDNKCDQYAGKITLRSLFQLLEMEKGRNFSATEIQIKQI